MPAQGIPASYNSLQVTGGNLSPDPRVRLWAGLADGSFVRPAVVPEHRGRRAARAGARDDRVVLNPGQSGATCGQTTGAARRARAGAFDVHDGTFAVKGIVTDVVDDVSMEPVATASNRAIRSA